MTTDNDRVWVIRADFSDDAVWNQVREQVSEPQGPDDFLAHVRPITDPEYRDVPLAQLLEHVRSHSESEFCFVVDSHFVQQPQHRVRVIDPGDDGAVSTTTFRAVPSALQLIEDSLSIANMDFDELRRR